MPSPQDRQQIRFVLDNAIGIAYDSRNMPVGTTSSAKHGLACLSARLVRMIEFERICGMIPSDQGSKLAYRLEHIGELDTEWNDSDVIDAKGGIYYLQVVIAGSIFGNQTATGVLEVLTGTAAPKCRAEYEALVAKEMKRRNRQRAVELQAYLLANGPLNVSVRRGEAALQLGRRCQGFEAAEFFTMSLEYKPHNNPDALYALGCLYMPLRHEQKSLLRFANRERIPEDAQNARMSEYYFRKAFEAGDRLHAAEKLADMLSHGQLSDIERACNVLLCLSREGATVTVRKRARRTLAKIRRSVRGRVLLMFKPTLRRQVHDVVVKRYVPMQDWDHQRCE
jgi:hypothetical protein